MYLSASLQSAELAMQLVAATEEREEAQAQIRKLEAELEAAQVLLEDQKKLLAGQSAILTGDVQDARAAAARVSFERDERI